MGDKKVITYCNKYINNIILGCNYHDQNEVTKLIPVNLNENENEHEIPEYFLNLLKEEFN